MAETLEEVKQQGAALSLADAGGSARESARTFLSQINFPRLGSFAPRSPVLPFPLLPLHLPFPKLPSSSSEPIILLKNAIVWYCPEGGAQALCIHIPGLSLTGCVTVD